MDAKDEVDDELRKIECDLSAACRRLETSDLGVAGLLRGARVLVGEARDWLALEEGK